MYICIKKNSKKKKIQWSGDLQCKSPRDTRYIRRYSPDPLPRMVYSSIHDGPQLLMLSRTHARHVTSAASTYDGSRPRRHHWPRQFLIPWPARFYRSARGKPKPPRIPVIIIIRERCVTTKRVVVFCRFSLFFFFVTFVPFRGKVSSAAAAG